MDDVLLRRLVGAAVLLVVAFALASLLPDPQRAAPAAPAVTYDLRTGKPVTPPETAGSGSRPEAKTPPPVGEGEAEAPAPAAAPLEHRPALKVDETLDDSASGWWLQVGSFSSQANARAALRDLYGMGMPTIVQSVPVGKTLWYRVRVGPYPDESAAQKALAKVRQQGYPQVKLVKPDSAPEPKGN